MFFKFHFLVCSLVLSDHFFIIIYVKYNKLNKKFCNKTLMGQLFSSVMTRAFIYQIPYHKYHREVGKQKMKWKFNSISAMIFCKQSRGRVCFSVGISCSKRSILLIIHGSLFLSPWQSTSAFYV